MKRVSTKNRLLYSTMAGLLSITWGCGKPQAPQSQSPAAGTPAEPAVEKHSCGGKDGCGGAGAKHACKAMNECKGQGGCAVEGKNACKGKNECKGHGGCKTA